MVNRMTGFNPNYALGKQEGFHQKREGLDHGTHEKNTERQRKIFSYSVLFRVVRCYIPEIISFPFNILKKARLTKKRAQCPG